MALRDKINAHILSLEPYQPGKPIEELERELGLSHSIKLASNENPLGPSPRAVAAIRDAAAGLHRYPDGASFELRRKLDVPIAGGENEHSPFGFYQLIKAGAVDVAQPDVGSCGGITAARDITAIAHAAGVAVNPHVWGSAVAQAASLQVLASLPVPHASLFATEPILEFDCSAHPFRQDLITTPWQMVDGQVAIPDGPGLGIEVRMDTVERYRC